MEQAYIQDEGCDYNAGRIIRALRHNHIKDFLVKKNVVYVPEKSRSKAIRVIIALGRKSPLRPVSIRTY